MHLNQIAVPLLVGVTAVRANLDMNVVFKADPALKKIKPSPTPSIDRVATAHSIISKLQSSHKASMSAASAASAAQATVTMKTSVRSSVTKAVVAKSTAKTKQPESTSTRAEPEPAHTTTKKAGKQKRAVPTTTSSLTTSSAAASCPALSYLYNYAPNPNTNLQFSIDNSMNNVATAALAPAGYTRQMVAGSASIFADQQYLTYQEQSSYNVSQCAAFCDSYNGGCAAFNIYFERAPVQQPGAACTNPAAAAMIKCALWKSQINPSQANNFGEFRSQFMVLVAGSNLYWRNSPPASYSAYTGPVALPGFVDLPASQSGLQTNVAFYPGNYDGSQCAALCTATNSANYAAAVSAGSLTYATCNFFDAAWISVNGVTYGTYCGLYSTSSVASTADIYYDVIGGVQYDVTYSYAYTLTNQSTGIVSSPSFYIQVPGSGTVATQYLKANGTSLVLVSSKTSADVFRINGTTSWLFDTAANAGYQLTIKADATGTLLAPMFTVGGAVHGTGNYNVITALNSSTNAVTFTPVGGSASYNAQICSGTFHFGSNATAVGCTASSFLAVAA